MSQRQSGYEREAFDKYQTPAWATQCLTPHIPQRIQVIWEPASGDGHMVRALRDSGYEVGATDIQTGQDFLADEVYHPAGYQAIVSNPPYDYATEFCERAFELCAGKCGERTFVAMLLRIDFDSALTRQHLFACNQWFSKKVVLLNRIRWEGIEQHTASPSFNHAWYCWDFEHQGPATIAYAQKSATVKPIQEVLL